WFGSCTMLSATHAEEASSRYLYCKPLPCRHRDGRSRRWLFFSERWPWLNRRATRASSSMRVQRAGATISSVVSIHVSMVSHPDVVATLIARAAAQEKRFLYLPRLQLAQMHIDCQLLAAAIDVYRNSITGIFSQQRIGQRR